MKKKSIKFMLFLLCISSVSLVGCESYSTPQIDKEIESISDSFDLGGITEKKPEEKKSVEIEEKVIFEQDNIVITSKGIESDIFGTSLKILIENNSNKNLIFQTKNESVNGFMAETLFSEEVASGKKSNASITFTSNGLEDFGLSTLANMEFSFHIFEAENWETYLDSDVISIDTSIANTYTQNYDSSGNVLYENNGIKIVGKGLSSKDSFFGPGLVLYIENNSNTDFTVQSRDVSVNGFMIDSTMSQDVLIGKKSVTSVTFFESSLEENNITNIENVEISFHIFNMNTWDTIVDTESIIINF